MAFIKRNTILIPLLFFTMIIEMAALMHPLKMSVATIKIKNKKLQLNFMVFADDLGVELGEFCKSQIVFSDQPIPSELFPCIEKYVNQNFVCSLNNSELILHFKKAQVEFNDLGIRTVKIEYESSELKTMTFKSMKVKNSLLFRFMGAQKNIVNIDLFNGNDIKVLRFDNEDGPVTKEVVF